MAFFAPGSHFIGRGQRGIASHTDPRCETIGQSNPDSPFDHRLFLDRGIAPVRADADRRQRPGRHRDAAKSPHGGVSRPHRRPAWLSVFRRDAGGNPRGAGDHPPRRPYQGLCGVRGARGRLRDPHARHGVPVGLARMSGADRVRVRRALRGDRVLDQRQGDQCEPGLALCALPDREFRRFRERAAGAETAGSGRLFALRGRWRIPRARHPSDGDDQRRSARPAQERAPPPRLARAQGADFVRRRVRGRSGERGPVRARSDLRSRTSAWRRPACLCSPLRSCWGRRWAFSRSQRSPTTPTAG